MTFEKPRDKCTELDRGKPCKGKNYALHFCKKHYKRWRRETGLPKLVDVDHPHHGLRRCGSCKQWLTPPEFGKRDSGRLPSRCARCNARNSRASVNKKRKLEIEPYMDLQGGLCANPGCRKDLAEGKWHEGGQVDHDHTCCPGGARCAACTRGILCKRCNVGLGFFDDDPAKLRGILWYIETWQRFGTPPPVVAKRYEIFWQEPPPTWEQQLIAAERAPENS